MSHSTSCDLDRLRTNWIWKGYRNDNEMIGSTVIKNKIRHVKLLRWTIVPLTYFIL